MIAGPSPRLVSGLREVIAWGYLALMAWSAFGVSSRLRVGRSQAETVLVTGILLFFLPGACWYALSIVHGFRPLVTPLVCLGVSLGAMALTRSWRAWRRLRLVLSRVRQAFSPSAEALLYLYTGALIAAFALFISLSEIVLYPTWSWDCVWYHSAQTRYSIQEHSVLYWVPTSLSYVNGYPRFVEATSAFGIFLLGNDAYDDASQLGWALVGVAAVAAWCRRFSCSRALSLALGLGWFLLPAVFLQVHTTHADVAAGAELVSLAYFVFAPRLSGRALALAGVCAGLLLATKISGLLLILLLSPVVAIRLVSAAFVSRRAARAGRHRRSSRSRFGWVHGLMIASALAMGLAQPVHNYLRKKNPFYPARVTVPLVHLELPGELEQTQIVEGRPFLADRGSVAKLVATWTEAKGEPIFPDIRSRPFGLSFVWLTAPLFAAGFFAAIASRGRSRYLSLLYLAGASLMVPASWWGRFTLGVPAAALIGTGFALQAIGGTWRPLRFALLAALGVFAVEDWTAAMEGYRRIPPPRTLLDRPGNERELRASFGWLLSYDNARRRDTELSDGDIWVYDQSTAFLGELWNRRVTSRAEYVSSEQPREDYVAAVRALAPKAKWLSVRIGSVAEQAVVQDLGGTLIFKAGEGNTDVYRLP